MRKKPAWWPAPRLFREVDEQPGAAAFPYFSDEFPYGSFRDDAAFTTSQRSAGLIDRGPQLHPPAFAIGPKSESFLHGFFLTVQTPAFDRPADEGQLI